MPYQLQGVDLPSIFLAAQQARANEQAQQMNAMKLAELQRQSEIQQWLPQARAQYFAGDPAELQRLAPDEAMKYGAQQAESQKARQEALLKAVQARQQLAEEARKRAAATSQFLLAVPPEARMNADAVAPFQQTLKVGAEQGIYDAVDMQQPSSYDTALAQVQATQERRISDKGLPAAEALGLDPRDPRTFSDPRFQGLVQEWGNPKPIKPGDDAATKLRQEFQALQTYKDAQLVGAAFEKVKSTTPNAAGDMALVYGLMKIYDPGSVVRETEYANAENAAGVPEQLRTRWNRLLAGERLGENQRVEFKNEAALQFNAQMKRFNAVGDQYKRLARKAGVSPEDVVLPFSPPEDGIDKGADKTVQPIGSAPLNPIDTAMPTKPTETLQAIPPLSDADARAADAVRSFMKQEKLTFEAAVLKAASAGLMTVEDAKKRIAIFRARQAATDVLAPANGL